MLKTPIFRNILLTILGVTFCLAVLSGVYIHISYASKMPKEPQPQIGRVFQLNVNHGTVVYVTKEELDRAEFVLRTVPYVAIICFAAFGLITVYFKRR